MGRGSSLIRGGVGKEAEDTEVAGSEDTELQVSQDPGQGRQAPAEGAGGGRHQSASLKELNCKEEEARRPQEGGRVGNPPAQPPSLPTLCGWI